jgi:hypothetical protein
MVSPVETAIQQMLKVGFFDILAFILFLAIFYAMFRKSRILGESVFVNGIAAVAISFFVFLYPFLTGFSLIQNLVMFFAHASLWILLFLIAFLLASFFYPRLAKNVSSNFCKKNNSIHDDRSWFCFTGHERFYKHVVERFNANRRYSNQTR